jgi:hypothetical protein
MKLKDLLHLKRETKQLLWYFMSSLSQARPGVQRHVIRTIVDQRNKDLDEV